MRNFAGDHWNSPDFDAPQTSTVNPNQGAAQSPQKSASKAKTDFDTQKVNAQLTYNQQQVANWKGEIRQEYCEIAQFSDDELLAMLKQVDRENNLLPFEAEGEDAEDIVD